MAQIVCPDCGRSISSDAITCVGCGRPIDRLTNRERRRLWFGALAITAIVAVWIALWHFTARPARDVDRAIRSDQGQMP